MKRNRDLPEEKLLKLIKEGKQSSAVDIRSSTVPDIVLREKMVLPRLRLSFFQLKLLLFLMAGVALVLLIKSFFVNNPNITKIAKDLTASGLEAEKTVRPLEGYLSIAQKTVFQLARNEAALAQPAVLPDMTKDIVLVGILFNDTPQAVVEDKKSQQAYYLSKGQVFGEIKVIDIQENKVIIESGGTRSELHL